MEEENNDEENLLESQNKDIDLSPEEKFHLLMQEEGINIKADIEKLYDMGFDIKMVNKVYMILRPESIERAVDYMTEINGIYQHKFFESNNPKEKNLCSICNKPKQNHLDNEQDINAKEDQEDYNNNIVINEDNQNQEIEKSDNFFILNDKCGVCYEDFKKEEKRYMCSSGHLFCTNCWFEYLKSKILEGMVEPIKCMGYGCDKFLSDEFILLIISIDDNLTQKYYKFSKRIEIFLDKNKKWCPHPDCDSFLQRSEETLYVKCENGHKYCFKCLNPPHENKLFCYTKTQSRPYKLPFVKNCPRCQIHIEKLHGCNRIICPNCHFDWCWICEKKCNYNHYKFGNCEGKDFSEKDEIDPKSLENNKNYFGIHKIFKSIYKPVDLPMKSKCSCSNYAYIFFFWFFGVFLCNINAIYHHLEIHNFKNECVHYGYCIIGVGISITLFIAFEILFTCCITPFIIISLFYPPFFERITLFFAIGESSEEMNEMMFI